MKRIPLIALMLLAGSIWLGQVVTDPTGESGDAVLGPPDRLPLAGNWPDNEPPGMKEIFFADGSMKVFPDATRHGKRWLDDHYVEVVEDPESKYGHAIERRSFVGDPSGWHGYFEVPTRGAWNELYIRVVAKVSPNYEWHAAGEKWWVMHGAGNLMNVDGAFNQPNPADRKRRVSLRKFLPIHETAVALTHVPYTSTQPNLPAIDRGRYITIEVLARRDPGCYRAWIDDVEVEQWWAHGDDDGPFDLCPVDWGTKAPFKGAMELFNYWGGQNQTKKVDDWIRISEIKISGR